jgi:hypothetical protein
MSDKVRIVAVIGSESHTTSRGWANISVNGSRLNHRDAVSKDWLTNFKDKHASWVECVFEVPNGATVTWEAGANSGSRGSDRRRQNLVFTADAGAGVYESESIGYPASNAKIQGRLRLAQDVNQAKAQAHQDLLNNL